MSSLLREKKKEVRNALKQDWKTWLHEITEANLDIRDKMARYQIFENGKHT